MKKVLPFLLITVLFTSCFEIIEEVTINHDGSGVFEYTLNMSQSKEEIESLRELDSMGSFKIPTEKQLNWHFDRGFNLLSNSDGIHNVKITKDYKEYIFTLRFEFDSVAALNSAFQHTLKTMARRPMPEVASIGWDEKQYIRQSGLEKYGLFDNLGVQALKALKTSSYVNIVRLPKQGRVIMNKNVKTSKSKKAFMLRTNMLELARQLEHLDHIIVAE